jgi:hypothetical protein
VSCVMVLFWIVIVHRSTNTLGSEKVTITTNGDFQVEPVRDVCMMLDVFVFLSPHPSSLITPSPIKCFQVSHTFIVFSCGTTLTSNPLVTSCIKIVERWKASVLF